MKSFFDQSNNQSKSSIDKNYLVLSLHDVCIGPMFKALLRHELLTRDKRQRMIVVSSAGLIMTQKRRSPPTMAVHCLNKVHKGVGSSIADDNAKSYKQVAMSEMDVVICLELEVLKLALQEAKKPGVRVICMNSEYGGIRSPRHMCPQEDSIDEYDGTIRFMRELIYREIISQKPV